MATIGGTSTDHNPSGIEDVSITWKMGNGKLYCRIFKGTLYFPESPVKILSCTALEDLNDKDGT